MDMNEQEIRQALKSHADALHNLDYALRLLKGSKPVTRQAAAERVVKRAEELTVSISNMGAALEAILSEGKEQAAIPQPEHSPSGLAYSSTLAELGFTTRAITSLNNIGVTTLAGLAALDGIGDLMKIRNFGRKGLEQVEAVLKRAGLELK